MLITIIYIFSKFMFYLRNIVCLSSYEKYWK